MQDYFVEFPQFKTATDQLPLTQPQDSARVFVPNGDQIIGKGLERITVQSEDVATVFADVQAIMEREAQPVIEALRAAPGNDAPAGLLRGLADARVAAAMRQMHGDTARPWTMAGLAKEASLSRSAFFDRFVRAVGMPPMEYLLAWRMAVAKDLLRRREVGLDEVAARVGYGSASTFSTAFSRHVGQPPGRYARGAGLGEQERSSGQARG